MPLPELDDWTQGEMAAVIEADRVRLRRQYQALAGIEYTHALLVGRVFAGGTVPAVYEAFPFWTEEEVREMRIAKYKAIMEHHVAKGKRGEPDA